MTLLILPISIWQRCICDRGTQDSAIEEYKRSLTSKPDYDLAHYGLGLAYLAKGETDMAIAEWEKTLKINDRRQAPFIISHLLFRQGR